MTSTERTKEASFKHQVQGARARLKQTNKAKPPETLQTANGVEISEDTPT